MTERDEMVLAPCPFCGGAGVAGDASWTSSKAYDVECNDCGASVPIEPTPELAASHWNARYADQSRFEAVLSFLDELADNAAPGKRKALNPIIIGGSAKLYAEGLRSAIAALPAPGGTTTGIDFIDALAQEIRRVDGSNSLGAAALAEALAPFLATITHKNEDVGS